MERVIAEWLRKSEEAIIPDPRPYDGPKAVVYGATRNVYGKMEVAAKSLIANTDVDKVIFLVEDNNYKPYKPEDKLPEYFETINVAGQTFFSPFGACTDNHWTYMSLMRCALHRMLPQYDRILWLDIDTYVVDDISELYALPIGNCYAAMCKEKDHFLQFSRTILHDGVHYLRGKTRNVEFPYYNAGVMLMNLRQLRDGTGDKILNAVNETDYKYPDQDAINDCCFGRIYPLDSEYNAAVFTAKANEPKIIHYSGHDTDEENVKRLDRYLNTPFEKIVNWRKARKEYLKHV